MRVLALLLPALCLASCHRGGLPPRPDGAAVVVAVENPEDAIPKAAETEPNDTPAQAQRLSLTEAGPVAVNADLSPHPAGTVARRDVDFFRIDPPARDAGVAPDAGPPAPRLVLRAEVHPATGLPVTLEATDEAGHALIAVTGQPGETVVIPNLAVRAAPVLLRVRAAAGEAPPLTTYKLVARFAPFDAGAEIEPNGDATHATDLSLGGEAVGYLGWHHDQDWYRLSTTGVAEGSVLSADVDPIVDVAATLQLYAADGHKLSEAHGRKGERVVLRSVRIPPSEQSPFLSLVVRADAGWSADARYNLRPRADLPKAGTESEPNDDVDHAQPIEDGTAVGYLARGDVDFYRYTTPGIAVIDVEVAPPERAAVEVSLQRGDGTLLGRAESSRHGPARIAGASVPGGPVFIRIALKKGSGAPDEPYRLTVGAPASQ
ncbi:MAG TPA: hypothetical protein VMT03_20470 [Polyangia bacterium]|nr:hypothetical protein [Polyangia bacterium]